MIKRVDTNIKWNGEDCKIKGKAVTFKSVEKAAFALEGQISALCPVDEGRLRGSITIQTPEHGITNQYMSAKVDVRNDIIKKPQKEENRDIAAIGTNVYYSKFVEYGTKKMTARPFMRPAIDLYKGNVLTVFTIEGRKEFKEYFKK